MMGRSVTPTYRVEVRLNTGYMTPSAWNCKQDGRPTEANLEKWRKELNASFQPDGVNGPRNDTDTVIHIISAKIIRQRTGEVVSETTMPMFEVV